MDFQTSVDLMDGFFDAIDLLEEFQTETIRNQLSGMSAEDIDMSEISQLEFTEFRSLKPLFETLEAVLPDEYRDMIITELDLANTGNDFGFWATIKRDKLETSPVELISKHQSQEVPNCTMLARVESITTEPNEDPTAEEINQENDDFEFGELLHVANDLGSEFGLNVEYPKVSVSPISIYR